MDVIETSRGCPSNCKFCSITHQNYFIRNYLWSFLGGQIINLAATIGYILRGNPGRTSLDL
jgi:hypothetical protein